MKNLSIQKAIKEKNIAFNKLTKAEKAVWLAKDVLAEMKKRRYLATKGMYFGTINYIQDNIDLAMDVKKNFDVIENCEVCALGACILSWVKVNNHVTFRQIENNFAYRKEVFSHLGEVFGKEQLFLIESAFEGYDQLNDCERVAIEVFGYKPKLEKETIKKIDKFYNRYKDDSEKRLAAIMRNIIRNEGKFVL